MSKCAIYARVSSKVERDGTCRQDTEVQLDALRAYAKSQGWDYVEFTDNSTGSNGDRPGFQALMSAASRHEFETVLFWALDRLTREGALKALTYLRQLDDFGVGYTSLQESWLSTAGPLREVFIAMFATFAKLEREKIISRTREGLAHARANGVRLGRRPNLTLMMCQKVIGLRKGGLSWRQVMDETGLSLGTAQRAARLEGYR